MLVEGGVRIGGGDKGKKKINKKKKSTNGRYMYMFNNFLFTILISLKRHAFFLSSISFYFIPTYSLHFKWGYVLPT